jgi:hypothetical protein
MTNNMNNQGRNPNMTATNAVTANTQNNAANMNATNAVTANAQNNAQGNKRVAIEPNLGPIQQYLQQQGYQCEQLNEQTAADQGYRALIISGADRNLMGIQNATTTAPVINAEGLTPQDVANRLQQLQ